MWAESQISEMRGTAGSGVSELGGKFLQAMVPLSLWRRSSLAEVGSVLAEKTETLDGGQCFWKGLTLLE